MQIEVWADVVCPWCYIGKRRLERGIELAGLTLATGAEAAPGEVAVRWRSFQLDPAAPMVPTESVAAWLGAKYGGGPEAGAQMIAQVEEVAAGEGLAFRHAESLRINTRPAHQVLQWAAGHGPTAHRSLWDNFFAGYFAESANLADPVELATRAESVGLRGSEVARVLSDGAFATAVDADIDEAAQLGAQGVPFVVVDRRFAVAGAQPAEAFASVIERASE